MHTCVVEYFFWAILASVNQVPWISCSRSCILSRTITTRVVNSAYRGLKIYIYIYIFKGFMMFERFIGLDVLTMHLLNQYIFICQFCHIYMYILRFPASKLFRDPSFAMYKKYLYIYMYINIRSSFGHPPHPYLCEGSSASAMLFDRLKECHLQPFPAFRILILLPRLLVNMTLSIRFDLHQTAKPHPQRIVAQYLSHIYFSWQLNP